MSSAASAAEPPTYAAALGAKPVPYAVAAATIAKAPFYAAALGIKPGSYAAAAGAKAPASAPITPSAAAYAASVMRPRTLHIVFHSHCIDGWFSAFIAYNDWSRWERYAGVENVELWPISPNQEWSWPKAHQVRNAHVLLVDVTVSDAYLTAWERTTASLYCIDHHLSAMPIWEERLSCCTLRTDRCAAWLTWEAFHPEVAPPEWLAVVDRIDRWCDVTEEDKALRELMQEFANLAAKGRITEAVDLTRSFLFHSTSSSHRPALLEKGRALVAEKEAATTALFDTLPTRTIELQEEHGALWGLPPSWLGHTAFIIETTGASLDSTQAANSLFETHSHINLFVSYRHKRYVRRDRSEELSIVYSVRAREGAGIDLTLGALFAGHPCAAGGCKPLGEKPSAFVLSTA